MSATTLSSLYMSAFSTNLVNRWKTGLEAKFTTVTNGRCRSNAYGERPCTSAPRNTFDERCPRASLDRLGHRAARVHHRRSRPHHPRRLGLQTAYDKFAASPGVLSTFVVLQVIVYAAAQVPPGLLLDRFGSRVLIVCGAALMAAGQLVLALSESLPAAIGARAIVGLGDALTFISVLRLVPHWFEPARVPLVAQLTGICGQLGQVLSAVPVSGDPHGRGWTPAYLSVAAFGLVVIVLALALIRRNTPHGSAMTPNRSRCTCLASRPSGSDPAPGSGSSPTWAPSSR